MFKYWQIILLLILIFLSSNISIAQTPNQRSLISLDLQNVDLADALRILAKTMHMNMVVGTELKTQVSLHLDQVSARDAFNSLLISHNLRKWQMNQVWFIGRDDDFLKYHEAQLKIQSTLEESAPLMVRVWQIHYAKAKDLSLMIQDNQRSLLSKRGSVSVDKRTNIICVHDINASLEAINRLILQLDVRVPQVLIKVRLASIDYDYQKKLGADWTSGFHMGPAFTAKSLTGEYGLTIAKLKEGSFLDLQLSALETSGHGELISAPSLFTASRETATIEAGEEIPYQEISKSGATGTAFKKAVLSLQVTPEVMPGSQVLLELKINQDKPNNRVVLGVPAISTRQISTHILVKNGQTLVLGGIFETNQEQEERRVPFLGRIPIMGWLFRQQAMINNKRELMMFVTPHIIH